jgi:hypothetical protein
MRCFGLVIDGRARVSGIRRPAADATLLLVTNSYAGLGARRAENAPAGTAVANQLATTLRFDGGPTVECSQTPG